MRLHDCITNNDEAPNYERLHLMSRLQLLRYLLCNHESQFTMEEAQRNHRHQHPKLRCRDTASYCQSATSVKPFDNVKCQVPSCTASSVHSSYNVTEKTIV
jgi:hypothetical protein